MRIADRIDNLGTETAFAVSAQAAAWAAKGHKVYPFHLGDLNLPTPPNVVEAASRAMADGKTGYCPNGGILELRQALAAETNRTHGTSYGPDQVSIQPGGKPVIGKFLLAVMNPGDGVLYPNPGFPIYESMINFHGGIPQPYGFVEGEHNFALDMAAMEAAITDATRVLILNDLHNPSGAECGPGELERVAELALKHDLWVLADEAYFDIRYQGQSRSLLELEHMAERCVILHTFSKKFAMTGWRLGGALGPEEIIKIITQLNVNDESCTAHFVQWAGVEALTGDQSGSREILKTLQARRDVAVDLLNSIAGVRCYRPQATFYLFPNVTEAMAAKGFDDYEPFTQAILKDTGVSLCSRAHFGRALPGETQRYLRLAYSGIGREQIAEGLAKLKEWIEA